MYLTWVLILMWGLMSSMMLIFDVDVDFGMNHWVLLLIVDFDLHFDIDFEFDVDVGLVLLLVLTLISSVVGILTWVLILNSV